MIGRRPKANLSKQSIINFLAENYLPDLRKKHIVTEHYIDPLHFQDTLNCYLGSAFSVEPDAFTIGYLRPHNQSEDIHSILSARAGTHRARDFPAC
jgi:phytoene desaturase